jgi:hypothetical protein
MRKQMEMQAEERSRSAGTYGSHVSAALAGRNQAMQVRFRPERFAL